MGLLEIVLGSLAVWRLTHLLQAEDGPWDIVIHLRQRAGETFWGQLMDCFYCLSLWTALPFALLITRDWQYLLLAWPALSGAAILLERFTHQPTPTETSKTLPEEETNELLRK
jgi:hypothetical protein